MKMIDEDKLTLLLFVQLALAHHKFGVSDSGDWRKLREIRIILDQPIRIHGRQVGVRLMPQLTAQTAPGLTLHRLVRTPDRVLRDSALSHHGVPVLLAAAASFTSNGFRDLAEYVLRLLLALDNSVHDALHYPDLEVLLQTTFHHPALLPRYYKDPKNQNEHSL